MASYHVSVNKALTTSQQDLIDHREHCSADPEKLATVGRALGHQLRIKRNASEYALYTVSQVRQETPDNVVRMGGGGRNRLGLSSEFAATLHWCHIRRSTMPRRRPTVNLSSAWTMTARTPVSSSSRHMVEISSGTRTNRLSTSHRVSRPRGSARGDARVSR